MKRELFVIGGASGTGKTTVARALARELEADWLQSDHIWLAARAMLPRGSPAYRLLHIEEVIERRALSAAELVNLQYEGSEVLDRPLEQTIHNAARASRRLVVDGAWMLPSFLAGLEIPETSRRIVFLHEEHQRDVLAAIGQRAASYAAISTPRRRGRWRPLAAILRSRSSPSRTHRLGAEFAWEHGNRMRAEAEALGMPVIAARPRETLLARAKAALGLESSGDATTEAATRT